MQVASASDLVTTVGDRSNELGHWFGDPTQNEERRLRVKLVEQFQSRIRALFQPSFEAAPLLGVDQIVKGRHLKSVFEPHGLDMLASHVGWVCHDKRISAASARLQKFRIRWISRFQTCRAHVSHRMRRMLLTTRILRPDGVSDSPPQPKHSAQNRLALAGRCLNW